MSDTTTENNPTTHRGVTISEWLFVIATIVVVLIISSLPYVYAYMTVPPDKAFMGLAINVPDHGQYFSWMRELTYANLSANKLTPEPNEPVFFNLLWWGLGRLGHFLGFEGYAEMYQLLRVVAVTLFLLLTYRMSAWFFEDILMRRTAFLICTFASGFGWLLIVFRELFMETDYPLDILMLIFTSEGITLFCAWGFPHFLGAALYIFAFDLMLRGQTYQKYSYAVAAGIVTLFFAWQHAYDLALVYGILGSFGLAVWVRDRKPPIYLIVSGLIIFVISVWPGLYSVWLTSANPLWKEVLAQFDNAGVFTPMPWFIPVLMGPAFLLALVRAVLNNPLKFQGLSDNELFLKVWFWVNFALLYIPTDFQIHMLNGWQLPIAILATEGLFYYILPSVRNLLQPKIKNPVWIKYGLVGVMILIIIPTNLYLLLWRFSELRRHDYPYFLYQDELKTMEWLENNASPDEVVLSSETTGQYIPAKTGMFVFLGHWAQTLDYFNKREMVSEFFDPTTTDDRRQQILQNCNPNYECDVDYILYGPAERLLGDYQPESAPFLEKIHSENTVELYRVKF